jgi:hypothetical protein
MNVDLQIRLLVLTRKLTLEHKWCTTLYGSMYERFILMWDQCALHMQTDDKDHKHNPYHIFIYEIFIYYFLFVKYPMQKFDIIWSAKFSNLYLVIFCWPFIQFLGNVEELKTKTYVSFDPRQDHKLGRVAEVTTISNYLCFHVLNFNGLLLMLRWQTRNAHKQVTNYK